MALTEVEKLEISLPEEQESEDKLQIQEIASRILEVIGPLISNANDQFRSRAVDKGLVERDSCPDSVTVRKILRQSEVQHDGTQSIESAEIGGVEILQSLADKLRAIEKGAFYLVEVDYYCIIRALKSMDSKLSPMSGIKYAGDSREDLHLIIELKRKYFGK